jgi:hypothetical protein
VISQGLFPESQTGLELLGSVPLSANQTLGYHLTLSNGIGPVSEYRDLDGNKGIGGRIFWSIEGFGQLRVGGSAFYARDTAARDVPGLDSQGQVVIAEKIEKQSDVLAFAADVQWTYDGLIVQAEYVNQQRRFTAGGRAGVVQPLVGQYVAPVDTIAHGSYVLAGYRFDWLGVMPYAVFADVDFMDQAYAYQVKTYRITGGLNIRPYDSVVLKVDADFGWFPDGYFISKDPLKRVSAQLAWAF